ncbi:hypothetical protein BRD10_03560 [Halobacteriales archaeon SW_12_71_31]|nr:MAG: hypothetical protein BRD10_03560 [Halobacteriales archaeon SW_12_71_31]
MEGSRRRLRPFARTALALVVGAAVFGLSVAVGGLLGAVLFFGVALLVQATVTAFVLIPALVWVGAPLMTALRGLPGGWLELYALFVVPGFLYGAVVAARLGRRDLRRRYGERLARQASVAAPDVCLVEADEPLAYTLPRDGGTLVVSRTTVETLDDDELTAVLAHEVAHVANGDLRAMPAATLPLLTVREVREKAVAARPWGLPFWAALPAVSYVAGAVVGAFARGRELAADDGAAAITGDPGALADALERLHDRDGVPTADLRERPAASALNVVGETTAETGLVASHPPVERRIERLRAQAAARSGSGPGSESNSEFETGAAGR